MKTMFLGIFFLVWTSLAAQRSSRDVPRTVTISDIDGVKLLDFCNEPEGTALQFCEAFILGVRDGVAFATEFRDAKPIMETPVEAKQHQLRAVVVKYLNDHPEEQHKPAGMLVIFELSQAFPPHGE